MIKKSEINQTEYSENLIILEIVEKFKVSILQNINMNQEGCIHVNFSQLTIHLICENEDNVDSLV